MYANGIVYHERTYAHAATTHINALQCVFKLSRYGDTENAHKRPYTAITCVLYSVSTSDTARNTDTKQNRRKGNFSVPYNFSDKLIKITIVI